MLFVAINLFVWYMYIKCRSEICVSVLLRYLIVWYECLFDTFNVIVCCMFVSLFDRPKLPFFIYRLSMRLGWKWQNKKYVYNNLSTFIKTKLPVLFEVMTLWLYHSGNSINTNNHDITPHTLVLLDDKVINRFYHR